MWHIKLQIEFHLESELYKCNTVQLNVVYYKKYLSITDDMQKCLFKIINKKDIAV